MLINYGRSRSLLAGSRSTVIFAIPRFPKISQALMIDRWTRGMNSKPLSWLERIPLSLPLILLGRGGLAISGQLTRKAWFLANDQMITSVPDRYLRIYNFLRQIVTRNMLDHLHGRKNLLALSALPPLVDWSSPKDRRTGSTVQQYFSNYMYQA